MSSPKVDLSPENQARLHNMVRGETQAPAFVFGSRVNGRARKFSDIDVCVVGVPAALLGRLQELAEESTIPYVVDFSEYSRLPINFREAVDREGVPIDELV